jgi:hypothetical protein
MRSHGGIGGMDGGNEITAAPACVPGAGAGASIADRASPVAPAEAQERAPKQNADRDGLEQKDSVNHFSVSLINLLYQLSSRPVRK